MFTLNTILKDGNPDITACGEMISEGKHDLIVAVHYFGKPALLEKLSDFSAKVGAWFIEDAVHVLHPIDDVGIYGDFVIYSPHKFFPIPDGGILISRTVGPSKITNSLLNKDNLLNIY